MSRVLRLLLHQLSGASYRTKTIQKVRNLGDRITRQRDVRLLSQCISFGPLAPTLGRLKRGYFDQTGSWKERRNGKLNELFTIGGILTFLGVRKEEEEERESVLINTLKRSILLIQKGELKKSEQMLHVALKLAQEQQNTDAITYIYDLLANLAYESREFPKAEKLFIEVLKREISKGTAENDNKVLHISVKLANIYKERGDKIKAEEGFKFCENQLSKKVEGGANDEDTLLLWAMTLDWYARFVLEQNRFKEAFSFFEKAYKTSLQVNGLIDERNVVLLNDLGTVCCLQNNYDEAIKYLNEAVDITKKIPDMEDAASIYVNLGTVYLKQKLFEQAKQACKEGLRNAKQMNNKEALEEANNCLEELNAQYTAQQAV